MDFPLLFVALFLILFGLAAMIKPELIWKIDHYFTVKNGEPTDLYLTLSRLGGILCLVIGVVGLIFGLANL